MASSEIANFYKVPVIVLPKMKIYEQARSATGRYSAPVLLDWLSSEKRSKGYKVIGLTHYDIFTAGHEVKEWGIFGLGNCPGNASVVSDFRLQKFKDKSREFTTNVILHELGHNFGLSHCDKNEKCLMNAAKGTIKPLYKEKKWLCPFCVKKMTQLRSNNWVERIRAWSMICFIKLIPGSLR